DGGDVLVGNALAAAVAALQGVQEGLPHVPGDRDGAVPVGPPAEPGLELPPPGELFGTHEPPLAGGRVGVGPLDFHLRRARGCGGWVALGDPARSGAGFLVAHPAPDGAGSPEPPRGWGGTIGAGTVESA